MNLKRWLHHLRHLNLMEHTFSSKLAEIDRDRQKLSDRLERVHIKIASKIKAKVKTEK